MGGRVDVFSLGCSGKQSWYNLSGVILVSSM